jgi:hypothetical protein
VPSAKEKDHIQPVIYVHYLVNKKDGKGPTRDELLTLLECLDLYRSPWGPADDELDFICKVDQQHNPRKWDITMTKRNERKYLGPMGFANKGRCKAITAFRNAVRDRLQKEAAPEMRPLCEAGYTQNAVNRLRQHQQHQSSAAIMNLVQAIMEVKFPGSVVLEPYICTLLWNPVGAAIGEIILTELIGGMFLLGITCLQSP